jgi:hypothetical protein
VPTSDGPAYEKKRKEERELAREILQYLRSRNEPISWDVMYAYFNLHGTGIIGPILHELLEGRYIAVDKQKKVSLTNLGLKRLEAAMF